MTDTKEKDIVAQEAFSVLKKDLMNTLDKNKDTPDFIKGFDLGYETIQDWLLANSFKNFFVITKAVLQPRKTEVMRILLEEATSFNELCFMVQLTYLVKNSPKESMDEFI